MFDFLHKRIDNAQLVVFRIAMGALLAWQCFYYLYNGWVYRNFILPKFVFGHIGLDWITPLPGHGMYYYYSAMVVTALLVMAGAFYRTSLLCFGLLWTGAYLMQKTVYNNHHYLIILVCIIMLFLPAAERFSIDSWRKKKMSFAMPAWCRWIMVFQMGVVYFFAAVAKCYPEWLNGTFTGIVLSRHGKIGWLSVFSEPWLHIAIAWAGLLFDLLVVPLLLWRKSRLWAFLALLLFHLFNWGTLKIGIFPFFALSLTLFFFPPETIGKLFFRRNFTVPSIKTDVLKNRIIFRCFILPMVAIQLLLPLRHLSIKGDVFWTEEGHRLSWRMMLRERKGSAKFDVVDRNSGDKIRYDVKKELTSKQYKVLQTHPDMLWQMAQHIREKMAAEGKDVAVYVTAECSINRKPPQLLINPKVDLSRAPWNYFGHCDWILLY